MAIDLSTAGLQAWLCLRRQEAKRLGVVVRHLHRRNMRSTAPLVASGGPVLSLTSYGKRLESVHLAIESIAAGSLLPSRALLWVDDPGAFRSPSAGIKRLMDRGLEVHFSKNYGPHTKYFPYLNSTNELKTPLVTGDDDLLYPRWWLEGLTAAHQRYPDAVNCFRAHSVRIEGDHLAPYRSWKPCLSTHPSFLHFGTGVSGCIYPPSMLEQLRQAGSAFELICPKADDVWLHVNALRAGIRTRQIRSRPLRFPFVPGTQDVGLYHQNVLHSGNDEQIQRTYTASDIARLKRAE